jgi:hypothetical protein
MTNHGLISNEGHHQRDQLSHFAVMKRCEAILRRATHEPFHAVMLTHHKDCDLPKPLMLSPSRCMIECLTGSTGHIGLLSGQQMSLLAQKQWSTRDGTLFWKGEWSGGRQHGIRCQTELWNHLGDAVFDFLAVCCDVELPCAQIPCFTCHASNVMFKCFLQYAAMSNSPFQISCFRSHVSFRV